LNKLEFLLPKDNLYQVSLNLACWLWKRRFLKFLIYFHSIAIISHWSIAILFIWPNLNPRYPRMICAKSG
jgi:hypothetical protein